MNPTQKLPDIYYFDFKAPSLDKKWLNRDYNLTDYFNYGFNEELWKCYINKVRKLYHVQKSTDYTQHMDKLSLQQINDG